MTLSDLLVYAILALLPVASISLPLLGRRRISTAAAVRFSEWAQRQQFTLSSPSALERTMHVTAYSRSDGRFAFVESAAVSSRSGSFPAQTMLKWTWAARSFPGSLHITRDPALGGGSPLPRSRALLAFAQATALPYVAYATQGPNLELTEAVIEHLPPAAIRTISVGFSEASIVFEEAIASEELFEAFLDFVAGLDVEGTTLVWRSPIFRPAEVTKSSAVGA